MDRQASVYTLHEDVYTIHYLVTSVVVQVVTRQTRCIWKQLAYLGSSGLVTVGCVMGITNDGREAGFRCAYCCNGAQEAA